MTVESVDNGPLEDISRAVVGGIVAGAKDTYRTNEAVGDAIIDHFSDPDTQKSYACGALGAAATGLTAAATRNPKAGAVAGIGLASECDS